MEFKCHFLGALILVINSSSCNLIYSSIYWKSLDISVLSICSTLPGPFSMQSFSRAICSFSFVDMQSCNYSTSRMSTSSAAFKSIKFGCSTTCIPPAFKWSMSFTVKAYLYMSQCLQKVSSTNSSMLFTSARLKMANECGGLQMACLRSSSLNISKLESSSSLSTTSCFIMQCIISMKQAIFLAVNLFLIANSQLRQVNCTQMSSYS